MRSYKLLHLVRNVGLSKIARIATSTNVSLERLPHLWLREALVQLVAMAPDA
jgi:hypothetical protein